MKKVTLILAIALLAAVVYADTPYGIDTTTNSIKVAPSRVLVRSATSPATWAKTNTYTQGSYIQLSNHVYMCTVGGTSTNTSGPSHTGGIATDNSVSWLYVPKGPRKGIMLTNDGTNGVIYGAMDATAVVNTGFRLDANGGWKAFSAIFMENGRQSNRLQSEFQGEFYAIPESGTTPKLLVQEW